MAVLEVKNLSHSFGKRRVLDDINFVVEEGEVLAIMGSSGGGKTTLLKCISGLLKPTEGEVFAAGEVGLVFQYAALFDYLNVRENILFGVKRQKHLSKQSADETVNYLLDTVSLEPETAFLMPSELSGGMRKRVGLARALAMTPKILLYDEPTSGLDPITAYSIDKLIVDTRNKLGMTSIVVSHDVTSVFRSADRIAFLSAGELVFWGTQQEFESSANTEIMELVQKSYSKTLTPTE